MFDIVHSMICDAVFAANGSDSGNGTVPIIAVVIIVVIAIAINALIPEYHLASACNR